MPLKTTGQLRAFLLKAIDDVSSGALEPGRAHAITKLAGQISASMMAEIEVSRVALKDNQAVAKFGALEIASEIDPSPKTIEGHSVTVTDDEPTEPERAPLKPSAAAMSLADAAVSIQQAKAARSPALAARIIDHRPSGVVDLPGTPPAGRSALDQRNSRISA